MIVDTSLPVKIYIVISLISKVTNCSYIRGRDIKMFVDHTLDDRISNSTLAVLPNLKRLHCADICIKHGDCYSFFYNEISKECALQDASPVIPENTTEQINWRYYTYEALNADVINSSEYVGGSGGTFFTDKDVWTGRPITALSLWCGAAVEGFQARYGSEWGPIHGAVVSTDDVKVQYIVKLTEYITGFQVQYDRIIFSMLIFTNQRTFPVCGGSGGSDLKTVQGNRLVYLAGKAFWKIDGIQPIWEQSQP